MIRNKHEFLTAAPIPRVIGTMAIPTIISMMVTSFYNIADTYFVSQINTQSTAAVGVIFTVMTIFQAVGFFFGHGSGNYMSISLGAGDRREAEKMAVTGFIYALSIAVVLAIAAATVMSPLCMWLGCTPTILPYAEQYLHPILLAAPFQVGSIVMNVQMRQQGSAAYALVGMMSGAVLNIFLDPLLIFGLDMGIRGAGVATLISQMVSVSILLFMTTRGDNVRLRIKNISFDPKYITGVFTGGSPSLTRQILNSIATLLLNVAAAPYGDPAIAAMTIVTRITFLVNAAVIGLGQGYQPMCGFCFGARKYDRLIKGYWFCIAVGTVFLTAVSIVGWVYNCEIITLFRDDAEVIRIGSEALRWQLLTFPLSAGIMLSNMAMQSIRKPIRASLLAAAQRGLFFVPFLLILPGYWGLQGVEVSQPLADMCSFVVALPVALYTFRRLRL